MDRRAFIQVLSAGAAALGLGKLPQADARPASPPAPVVVEDWKPTAVSMDPPRAVGDLDGLRVIRWRVDQTVDVAPWSFGEFLRAPEPRPRVEGWVETVDPRALELAEVGATFQRARLETDRGEPDLEIRGGVITAREVHLDQGPILTRITFRAEEVVRRGRR